MKAKHGRKGWLALKLDMEKAYNRMKWDFILKVLMCFRFNEQWVGWVKQFISIVSFSILLNGSSHGFFKPSQGLRQGNPLSPFLFILGAKVLSRLFTRAEEQGFLHGVKVARAAPPISVVR